MCSFKIATKIRRIKEQHETVQVINVCLLLRKTTENNNPLQIRTHKDRRTTAERRMTSSSPVPPVNNETQMHTRPDSINVEKIL